MVKRMVKMKLWKITGLNLKNLYIYASSFDEAIQQARKINRRYDTGQVIG